MLVIILLFNQSVTLSYLFLSPALQAYSHSASVGSLLPAHLQNATASFHETWSTGWSILKLIYQQHSMLITLACVLDQDN